MYTKPSEAKVGKVSVKYMVSIPVEKEKCNFASNALDGTFFCSAVCGIPKKHSIPNGDEYWVGWVQTILEDDIILHYENGVVAVVKSFIDKPKDQDNRQGAIDKRISWFESTPYALQPLIRMPGEESDIANKIESEKDGPDSRQFVDFSKQLLADYDKLKPRSAFQKLTHVSYVKKLKETDEQWTKSLENRTKQRVVHFWDSPCLTIPFMRPVYDDKNKPTREQKNIGFKDPLEGQSSLVKISGNTRFVLWLAVTYNSTMVKSDLEGGYPRRPIGPQKIDEFNPLYNIEWNVDWSATVKDKTITPTGFMTVDSHGAGKGKHTPTLTGDPATNHVGVRIYAANKYKG